MKKTSHANQGFTLVELLVVIAIIAVLAGIGSAALLSATDKAHTASEVNAAKTLVSAFQAATADRGGSFFPAFDRSQEKVINADGKEINDPQVKARYPFRLAQYFNYAIDSTLLAGKNQSQLLKTMNLPEPSGPMYEYGISQFPSLGINRFFVGGEIARNGRPVTNALYSDCIRSIAQADHSIIVFASAGTKGIDGYEYVRPPGALGGSWSGADWTEESDPSAYGYVHPRHDGKAVTAFLDGSTRLLSLEDLRDMRLWSRTAAVRNDPNFTVSR
jgi:prepilin-type N-terminal cleavage/methylation domain-containing protein/prepilin-type processing-associated H-X9-DG protein